MVKFLSMRLPKLIASVPVNVTTTRCSSNSKLIEWKNQIETTANATTIRAANVSCRATNSWRRWERKLQAPTGVDSSEWLGGLLLCSRRRNRSEIICMLGLITLGPQERKQEKKASGNGSNVGLFILAKMGL